MTVTFEHGQLWDTTAQAVGIGLAANGRLGVSPLHTALADRWPAFVSVYRQRGRGGLLAPGDVWIWRESTPWLVGLIVRETPQGAARLRYVEQALLSLAQVWEQEGLHSLALAGLAEPDDSARVDELLQRIFNRNGLSLTVYGDAFR
ncbi:hypothetical protein [Aggregatilinea lenta]|uniref:hypothetical protein n=1 Tax=Aggregatilinea lenta TaxID=913108 RepID=UPI000E5A4291|nr:hypothetical protein [Aggregatilinea lenta]